MTSCRVVLVDDHAVFRQALAKGLELTGQVTVVGQAGLIRQGASGYLHKSATLERVVRGVLRVNEGRLVVDEDLAEIIARSAARGDGRRPHEMLSSREHQVMERLVSGATVSAMAGEMNLSVKTISTYRRRLLDKLGVSSNSEMVSYAIRHSLTVYA